jgi:hypothetical protein
MPFQRPTSLSALASALAAVGLTLVAAGCGGIAPLGPDPAPASFPSARDLGSPILMQVMRAQPATAAGGCPAGSVELFGSEPNVLRTSVAEPATAPVLGSAAAPPAAAAPATPPPPGTGVACFLPVGRPVTVTSAAVSAVTTYPHQPGPAAYGFVVAFPAADIAALTAAITQAYDDGDALGLSVDGKLWQAPLTQHKFSALRAEQINLLSREQAQELYRLLVPAG